MVPASVLSVLVTVQGVKTASAQLMSIDASARKASKGAEVITKGAKVGAAAVAVLGVASIKAAGDYESSMNTLQAVSGATGKQMEQLSKLAVKLGADTKLPGTSAQDAAEAMTEMIKAGVSMKDTMAGVRSVLVLSAAAGISNARAAEIASNALNTFKLRGKDVTLVTDQLANTANASSVEIEDVAQATQMAGAVFSSFQGPVRGAKGAMTDLNVAIGLLGNAGIKGSDAGTSLKAALLHLAAPAIRTKNLMRDLYLVTGGSAEAQRLFTLTIEGTTKKIRENASNALEKLQGSTRGMGDIAYTAAGKMRSLPEIVDQVTRATKGMTQEQRNATITQIFGADATRSVLALMKAGPKEWDTMTAAVTRQGSAQELAEAKMKGFKGAMDSFKSTLETLAIEFGQMLLPAATKVMRFLASAFGKFGEHKKLTLAVVAAIGALSTAILTVNGAIKAYRSASAAAFAVTTAWRNGVALAKGAADTLALGMSTLRTVYAAQTGITNASTLAVLRHTAASKLSAAATKAQTIAQTALNLVMRANPVLRVVTVIAALVAGLVVAYNESETFRKIIEGAWKTLKETAAWMITAGVAAFNAVKTAVTTAWNAIKTVTTTVWNAIKAVLTAIWTGIRTTVTTYFNAYKTIITTAWTAVKTVTTTVWNGIKGTLGAVWGAIKTTASTAWSAIKTAIVNPVSTAVQAVRGALGGDGLLGWLRERFDDFKGAAEKLARPFVAAFEKIAGAVKKVLDFLGKVLDKVKVVIDFIGKIKIPEIHFPKIPFIGGGSGGGNVGPGVPAPGQVMGFDPLAAKFGLQMTSGYRPGDDGWHGQNRARDYSNGFAPTSEMLAFARYMVSHYGGKLLELIYTPLGFGIKNGQRVPLSFWGAGVNAMHNNHVHVAMKDGGFVKRGGWALVGEEGPELAKLPTGTTVYPHGTGPASQAPVVEVKIADGMEWLRQFVTVQIVERDRRSAGAYQAGAAA